MHDLLHNLHPMITLTMEHNFWKLPILDILLKNENDWIIIGNHHKLIDTQ